MNKIKKLYMDRESGYLEVTFENGEKHQVGAKGSEPILTDEDADKGFDIAYECEMVWEDK